MAGSFNTIVLVGNLGRDPELRYTTSGDPVADFSVATSERRRGPDGQRQEQTTWFRVSAFGNLADIVAQYLHKAGIRHILYCSPSSSPRRSRLIVSLPVLLRDAHRSRTR